MAAEGAVADVTETSPASTGSAAPDPKSASPAGTPPASQAEPKWEDHPRTKGTLTDLQNERKARQGYEKKIAEIEAQLAEERRRVGALTGITKRSAEEMDRDQVKAKLVELYPELADLGSIAEMRKEIEEQQVAAYTNHSQGMLAKIHATIAAEYGELTDRQKQRINAAYLYANQNNPEIHARHNAGDPSLVAEFAKEWIEDVVDPIKKKTAASEANRFRPVPSGRDRSMPAKGEKPKTSEELMRAKFRAHTR